MVKYTKPEDIELKVHNFIFSPSYNEKQIAYYVPLVTREESLMTYENKLELEKHLKAVILGWNEDTMGELEIQDAINRAINGFFEGKLEYNFSVYYKFSFRVDPSRVKIVSMVKTVGIESYIINLIFKHENYVSLKNGTVESLDTLLINGTIEALDGLYNVPAEVVLDSKKLLETLRFILNTRFGEGAGESLRRAHVIYCIKS